ncbi:unnamed protein product [Tilletia controversa]|nr:unnamed protein product [Tilletia controversa]
MVAPAERVALVQGRESAPVPSPPSTKPARVTCTAVLKSFCVGVVTSPMRARAQNAVSAHAQMAASFGSLNPNGRRARANVRGDGPSEAGNEATEQILRGRASLTLGNATRNAPGDEAVQPAAASLQGLRREGALEQPRQPSVLQAGKEQWSVETHS